MFTLTVGITTRLLFGASIVAFVLTASNVIAADHNVTITLPVSAKGLDLRQLSDARKFYTRLQRAAWVVCTHGNRVGLVPPDYPIRCYDKALTEAIRSAQAPLLTRIYLEKHPLAGTVAGGIYVPVPTAEK